MKFTFLLRPQVSSDVGIYIERLRNDNIRIIIHMNDRIIVIFQYNDVIITMKLPTI